MSSRAIARVEALRTIGRLEEAERVAREALQDAPDDFGLLLQLTDVVRRRGRHGEALEIADAAVRSSPVSWQPYAQRALALSALNRHPEACEAARYCVNLAPHDPHALLIHSAVHQGAGHAAIAYESARHAAALAPELPNAHLMVGFAASGSGDKITARRAYEEVLRLDPQNAQARHDIALLDLNSGKPGRAIDGFLAAGAMDPGTDLPLRENINATMWRLTVYVRWLLLASYFAIVMTNSTASEAVSSRVVATVVLAVTAGLTVWFVRKLPPQAGRIALLTLRADRLLVAVAVLSAMGVLVSVSVLITGIADLGGITLGLMVLGLVLTLVRGRQATKEKQA